MTLTAEKRANGRVKFARGIDVQIVAIDGTWRRPCVMWDVAQKGAKLSVNGSVDDLELAEFFLVLSSSGYAFRHCELAWVNGDHIGVRFLAKSDHRKKPSSEQPAP